MSSADITNTQFSLLPDLLLVLDSLQAKDASLAIKQSAAFKKKCQEAESQLAQLPGVDLSLDEQKQVYAELCARYQHKSALIGKYKALLRFNEKM
jgi:hypothetical protein